MEVINKIKIDLLKPGVKPMVSAMQADENSRVLEISLSANGSAWEIPDGVSFSMAYKKPDGTKGLYDTLPDGSSASSVDGSVVSIRLAPQMLTVPGTVTASVVISNGDQKISTFPIIVNVIQNPAVGAVGSEDYFYSSVIGNLDDLKTTNKSSLVAAINEIFSAGGGSSSGQNVTVDTTLTKSGQAADAKVVGDKMPVAADVNDEGLVSVKNAAGLTLFTFDLSGLGVAATYGNLVISVESLDITEGSSGTFTVCLESAPNVNQPVYLAVSDNARLSVSPANLTFTPDNYAEPQTVTITSLEDDDEDDNSVTVTLTSKKVDAKQVMVAIEDNDGVYIRFGGKEVISEIDFTAITKGDFGYGSSNQEYLFHDIANDNEVLYWEQDNTWISPMAAIRYGVLADKYSAAKTRFLANTTGAFTLFYEMSTINGLGETVKEMAPLIAISGANIKTSIDKCFYLTADGTKSSFAIENAISDVALADLAYYAGVWTKLYIAYVFHADGRVSFLGCDSVLRTVDPPADFASWDIETTAASGWHMATRKNGVNRGFIINDALTAQDIAEYYESGLESTF